MNNFKNNAKEQSPKYRAIVSRFVFALSLLAPPVFAGTCGIVDCLPKPSYPSVADLQAYVIGAPGDWHVGKAITAIANIHLTSSTPSYPFDNSYANVMNVTFYVNGYPVCQAFSMLYECNFFMNTPGTYKISAIAYGAHGGGVSSLSYTDEIFTVNP